jgi:hypothetical protein
VGTGNAHVGVGGLSAQIYTAQAPAQVPEPGSLALMLAGLAMAGMVMRPRRR